MIEFPIWAFVKELSGEVRDTVVMRVISHPHAGHVSRDFNQLNHTKPAATDCSLRFASLRHTLLTDN